MRILLSNDDGYFAPGLEHLAAALAARAEVTVVAPEADRSGASNSLTLDRPLMVRRAPNGFLFVNGTPTDCVHLAVTGLLDRSAGPRDLRHQPRREHGRRHDLLRHRRRRDRGLPARHSVDRDLARVEGGECISKRRRPWRSSSSTATNGRALGARLLNVNVPDMPRAMLKGYRITRLGRRHKAENVVKTVESPRRDRLLGRRRRRRRGRRRRHRFPRGRTGLRVGDAAADRPHEPRRDGKGRRVVRAVT